MQSPPNFGDSESGPNSFKSVYKFRDLCNADRFDEISSESEWSEPEDDLPLQCYASMTTLSPSPSPDSDDGLCHAKSGSMYMHLLLGLKFMILVTF